MNDNLKEAIEKASASFRFNDLIAAREQLTARYRDPERHGYAQLFMDTDLHRMAYVIARMPATYAIIKRVLEEVKLRMPDLVIDSTLDLGAGPGTAMWAAADVFPDINTFTMVEQDSALIKLGKQLAENKGFWKYGSMSTQTFEKHDLVIISYAIGELTPADQEIVIKKAWEAAGKVVVVIEPGTIPGFQCIRSARQALLDKGAHAIAPCPHNKACPMPSNDWCHFSERIERTVGQKRLKSASLGYEDEKYSYITCGRESIALPEARILRHPQKHTGHIKFELCKDVGLKNETISKRDGSLYKLARKLEWGDTLTKYLEQTDEGHSL